MGPFFYEMPCRKVMVMCVCLLKNFSEVMCKSVKRCYSDFSSVAFFVKIFVSNLFFLNVIFETCFCKLF